MTQGIADCPQFLCVIARVYEIPSLYSGQVCQSHVKECEADPFSVIASWHDNPLRFNYDHLCF